MDCRSPLRKSAPSTRRRRSKAKEKHGREPQVKFGELVGMMVRADLQDQGREAYLKEGGYEVKRYRE